MPAGTRAIDLPDEGVGSAFLDAFGRPKRDTACECERVSDASLGQSLMLLNSPDIQAKLAGGGRPRRAAGEGPEGRRREGDELFWDAFARPPDSGESTAALDRLGQARRRREAARLRGHPLGPGQLQGVPVQRLTIAGSAPEDARHARADAGRFALLQGITRRGLLRGGCSEPSGLMLSRPAPGRSLGEGDRASAEGSIGDPRLARRRPAAARDVRPQARRPGRVSRPAQGDPDGDARRPGLRAAAASMPGCSTRCRSSARCTTTTATTSPPPTGCSPATRGRTPPTWRRSIPRPGRSSTKL